jgi:hypothetical protein
MALTPYGLAAIVVRVPRVEHHAYFAAQFEAVCGDEDQLEVAGEIVALLDALERHGHDIEGEVPGDASHPIVISRLRTFALRRTPPTTYTPYATAPPVIRIAYVWFRDQVGGEEVAVVMLMGDKTTLGNAWYRSKVNAIEATLVPDWERTHPTHRVQVRRTR